MNYITRMPKEFALFDAMDVRRGGHYDIRADKAIGKWVGENSKLFEMEAAA